MNAERLLQPLPSAQVDPFSLAPEQVSTALVGDGLSNHLCLLTIGVDVMAWCVRHGWGSIPGPADDARRAVCPGCEVEEEIARRRLWLTRHCPNRVVQALLVSEGQR